MKKPLAFVLILALSVLALGGPALAMQRYSAMYLDLFDTVITLIGYAESQQAFDKESSAVRETYRRLHKLFDDYHSYADEGIVNVYDLNHRAAKEPVEVSDELFGLLAFCKEHYPLAQGQTNVAMGSVLAIWHDYREAGLDDPEHAALPDAEALRAAAEHTDIDSLVLDEKAQTVFFSDPLLQLDVGAVGKGYATEIVAKMLSESDMPSFCISAGGNVRVGAAPQDGRIAWGVGLQKPDGDVLGGDDIVETLYLHDMSVVTSGDYQRYYVVDGKRYHHLIDPQTLMPGNFYRAVSIITADSGYADFLSTAAFLMPYEQSRAFIDSLDGVEAIWIFEDGTKQYTEGAKSYALSFGAKNR